MATLIQKLAYKLDTSPSAKFVMLVLELSIAGIAFFVQEYSTYAYIEYVRWGFWGLLSIIIILHLIIAYFGYAERLNVLIYNEKKGLLYDKTRYIENVSLRRSTLSIIFTSFAKSTSYNEDVATAGASCGKSFFNQFRSADTVSEEDTKKSDLLKSILEYDSSSGMGKYTLESEETTDTDKLKIELGILNPFIENHGNPNKLCIFVLHYLKAIVEEVHSPKKFKYTTINNSHKREEEGSFHTLILTEKN